MARVISEIGDPADIANRGERQVFAAFRKALPNHFLCFYALPFLRRHSAGGNLVDGENDFAVLDLQRGVLLLLEVKNGTIRMKVEGDRQTWLQNEVELDTSPWTQVKTNKYTLVEWLSGHLGCDPHAFPLSHGHAVLLPDVHAAVGAPMPSVTGDVSLTWCSEEDLAARVEHASEAWCQHGHRAPCEAEIDRVRCLLMPEFVYGNTLCDRIGVERRDSRLAEGELDRLLEFISNRKRARIAGCAGAGKTTLAVAKARQLAAAGGTVLFLVYNRALCAFLSQHLADAPGVKVQQFHTFCQERCGSDWPAELPVGPGFWWTRAPELLDAALLRSPVAYDALIVDEAQDFQFGAWMALDRAVKPDGWYYIFYDKVQNIYGGDLDFPVAEAPFLLLHNCRSTRAIVDAVRARTGIDMAVRAGMPAGEPVRVESADSPGQRRRLLGKILHDWIKKEGLSENQIVVLGAHSLEHTSIGPEGKAGSFRLAERGTAAPGVVPYYTYMAFKGCESDAVILLDVDSADPRWDKQGLYTAMTRARHLLAVVETGTGSGRGHDVSAPTANLEKCQEI